MFSHVNPESFVEDTKENEKHKRDAPEVRKIDEFMLLMGMVAGSSMLRTKTKSDLQKHLFQPGIKL